MEAFYFIFSAVSFPLLSLYLTQSPQSDLIAFPILPQIAPNVISLILFPTNNIFFREFPYMKLMAPRNYDKNRRKKSRIQAEAITQIEPCVFDKFQKFVTGQRIDRLRQQVRRFHGRNYPIPYRQQYNFHEQWETKKNAQKTAQANLIEQLGNGYLVFSVMLMVVNVFTIWTITYQRYFDDWEVSSASGVYKIGVVFHLADILLEMYYFYRKGKELEAKGLIIKNWYKIVCIAYFILVSFQNSGHFLMYLFEIVIISFLYQRSAEIYRFMKMMEAGLIYQNQVKIFNLFFNVFIQAHIFAIILYAASKMNPQKNWIQNANLQTAPAFTKYIYAFYFACTTMLTIGYGDITPRCSEEIVVTVMIEIIAVVSFGYLLNEMGHTLSKMREQSEELQRDLQTISKMSKYYNLERSLQNKAKAFLFSNQVRSEELKVEDEKRVLLKLNEELRQQIHHENSLTVVKSCVFFLCHWSKTLQSEVARRLEKRLFAPNQRLIPAASPARLFIVKHGRVDVFMNRFAAPQEKLGCAQDRRKLLKVIASEGRPEVSDNVYGYTAAFSNRAVRLQAVAAEFTSTYSVGAEEFFNAVRRNAQDFEYFHQVKSRIDQSAFSEQWQAPSINNIREHFAPSKISVIKKYRIKVQRSKNKRCLVVRNSKGSLKLMQNLVNKSSDFDNAPTQGFAEKTIEFAFKTDSIDQQKSDRIKESMKSSKRQYQSQLFQQSLPDQDTYNKSYMMALESLKSRLITKSAEENQNKKKISHIFEKHHEFQNFFRFSNISFVLNNLQRGNCLEKKANFYNEKSQKRPRKSMIVGNIYL